MPKRDRYHRQRLVEHIGDEGQERLRASAVLVVGVGALGTVSAELLCRAGVGTLRLVDRDTVEETNLQRQTLFTEADIDAPKAIAAADRLAAINTGVRIDPHVAHLGPANFEALLSGVDLVVDGTDNFETRFLLNDACVREGVPFVYAGAIAAQGSGCVVLPGETPCLRCHLPDPPAPGSIETCETAGVLAPATAMVASWQALQAVRVLGSGDCATGLHIFDLWPDSPATPPLRVMGAEQKPAKQCACCGLRKFDYLKPGAHAQATSLCGRDAVQVLPAARREIDLPALADRLADACSVRCTPFLLRAAVDDEIELTVFADGRAVVNGTSEPSRARAVYSRYVGD